MSSPHEDPQLGHRLAARGARRARLLIASASITKAGSRTVIPGAGIRGTRCQRLTQGGSHLLGQRRTAFVPRSARVVLGPPGTRQWTPRAFQQEIQRPVGSSTDTGVGACVASDRMRLDRAIRRRSRPRHRGGPRHDRAASSMRESSASEAGAPSRERSTARPQMNPVPRAAADVERAVTAMTMRAKPSQRCR